MRVNGPLPIPAPHLDILPEGPAPLCESSTTQRGIRRVILYVRDTVRTALNAFHLLREYPHRPSYDPEATLQPEDLDNTRRQLPRDVTQDASGSVLPGASHAPYWPFLNMSTWRLMHWLNTGGGEKSQNETDRLVHEVILAEDFHADELSAFRAASESKKLDKSEERHSDGSGLFEDDDWREVSVDIDIPTGSKDCPKRTFTVPGLRYRPLLGVIQAAFHAPLARSFHYSPFKLFWQTSESPLTEEQVYGEIYTSDAMLKAYDDLQKQPNEPGCNLEKSIAALMFWSDSTHLANFGEAKLWPIYLFFGNLTKYIRAAPGTAVCHHIAYIPSLPGSISGYLSMFRQDAGRKSSPVLTHCRRELFHAVWRVLLDNEFVHAYYHGIVIKCVDGITRRIYPRIFTYSADYPEKVLIAALRDQGNCPCPRCCTAKSLLPQMGLLRDLARRLSCLRTWTHQLRSIVESARRIIYQLGRGITSKAVEELLKPQSLTPTVNAFCTALGDTFDIFSILVVDFMHEVELGVWKALFTHLIRILYAAAPTGGTVVTLDARFRQIPTFGRATIRRFSEKASEMKKLAARDFEDLLQCAIPVFDGLLPSPHNEIVLTLLYRFAEWHALAKLRMHTDSTVLSLEKATMALGHAERQARLRRAAAQQAASLPRASVQTGDTAPTVAPVLTGPAPVCNTDRRRKTFNTTTYKYHALADYPRTIRLLGTTDSYTTQTGELEHRRVKRLYAHTNKKHVARDISKHERRETRLQRMQDTATSYPKHAQVDMVPSEPLPPADVYMHHQISYSRNSPINLYAFTRQFGDDPCVKDFIPKLKDHLLTRLLHMNYDGDEQPFTEVDRDTVRIFGNIIYSHAMVRVNYTTYDVRRDQDCMNPHTTHGDVLVKSCEPDPSAHPFWYARILGIFHASVIHLGLHAADRSQRDMAFLWVRWFGIDPDFRYGSKVARLPKIGFIPETDSSAFGFLDPSVVIRGCHLIPAFADGRTKELLAFSQSIARPRGESEDWVSYYVNIFVDRDMFMRYHGGGVGHLALSGRGPAMSDDADVDMEICEDQPESADKESQMQITHQPEDDDDGEAENVERGGDLSDSGEEDDSADDDDSESDDIAGEDGEEGFLECSDDDGEDLASL
ncbi:hypothetical protein BKA93DRAFT_913438 [Sparassis latifolia]